ncbi:MAG: L,D-transpeptidase [Labilithrix sp.]|nr:L,D-transpeptidase [Labilithrix sp.]
MQTNIYSKPSDTARKIGYLRLGAIVPRSEKAFGSEGCTGGSWYGVAPRGFVCTGKNATLEIDSALVRAASVRPDASRPLPYAYGFIRAVAPLYLRLPSKEESLASEFKLGEHLAWWERKGHETNRAEHIGANDLAREVIPDAPQVPRSDTLADGILLGGRTEADPPPFWLETGSRKIPNVSGFEVPAASIFANRVRRHTGIAFVGAFNTGPQWDNRRFAITADLRLIPVDKVKPEVASAFHGVELNGAQGIKLPVAFAKPCNPNAKGTPRPCVRTYHDDGGNLKRTTDVLPTRAFLELTGVQRKSKGTRFLETKSGAWVRASDVGVAVVPQEWPQAAQKGERWVDVSIEDQTLVLWEGQKPVYATLVSTGQDGLDDPKKSKATPRGTFRVRSKHITATMDSDGRSAVSGGAAPASGESPSAEDKHAGSFELRDVPYVQYFQDGYALHSAYWHDHFGLPRSHGCINLAPIDALRVFRFTDPPVPDGWHATNVEQGRGTSIVIHR